MPKAYYKKRMEERRRVTKLQPKCTYREKYNESPIDIINFLVHLHCKLNIERKICENNNSVENFNVKWSDILRML